MLAGASAEPTGKVEPMADIIRVAARANAAPKSMTLLHESSFIPFYDAYVKNKLAPWRCRRPRLRSLSQWRST